MKVTIAGAGYLGLTTAAVLAKSGHDVFIVDVIPKKIALINNGESPFYEPGLDSLMQQVALNTGNGKLKATSDYSEALAEAEFLINCVGTPAREDGSVNTDYIFSVVAELIASEREEIIYVTKSTVPVGTAKAIRERLLEANLHNAVLSCPEFLAESTAVVDTFLVDRFVVGGLATDWDATAKLIELFASVDKYARTFSPKDFDSDHAAAFSKKSQQEARQRDFSEKLVQMGNESAELVKVTANAFLATKISFANSIARLADASGANVTEVMAGVGADPRIGEAFLIPGLGWGGGCFPKDVAGAIDFANQHGEELEIVSAAAKVNSDQIHYVLEKARSALGGSLAGKSIAILGLSFKPNTSDVRESASLKFAELLASQGAKLKLHDPKAMYEAKEVLPESDHVKYMDSAHTAIADTDLIVLATAWPEYLELDWGEVANQHKKPIIFDARNSLDTIVFENIDLKYFGVGR